MIKKNREAKIHKIFIFYIFLWCYKLKQILLYADHQTQY